jgi:hypothetical protein
MISIADWAAEGCPGRTKERLFGRCALFRALVLCSILALSPAVRASEVIWAGAGSSAWTTGSNWVNGSVPGTNDTAAFKGWMPLSKSGWTVTASNTYSTNVPANTKDNDANTYWYTGFAQGSVLWLVIDL